MLQSPIYEQKKRAILLQNYRNVWLNKERVHNISENTGI